MMPPQTDFKSRDTYIHGAMHHQKVEVSFYWGENTKHGNVYIPLGCRLFRRQKYLFLHSFPHLLVPNVWELLHGRDRVKGKRGKGKGLMKVQLQKVLCLQRAAQADVSSCHAQVENNYAARCTGTVRGYLLIFSFREINPSNNIDANKIQFLNKYDRTWEKKQGLCASHHC